MLLWEGSDDMSLTQARQIVADGLPRTRPVTLEDLKQLHHAMHLVIENFTTERDHA